jgi:PAS domain-containing protein
MTRRAVPTEPPEQLLDMIYDAATEETLWTQALIQIADMTGSLGGMVVGADLKHGSVPFLFNGRMSEDSHRTYAERHVQNPWGDVMMHSPVGVLVQSDEILPLQNLKRTAFFDEVLRPQQLAHNAMLNLVSNDGLYGVFNLCRSERPGVLGGDAARLLSRLYPHMRRSLILGSRINGYRALQHAQSQALDRLSAGIMLIDRGSRVIFANTAARAMTTDDGPLRLHNSILRAVFPPDAQRLDAVVGAATRGDTLVRTVSLLHPHDGRRPRRKERKRRTARENQQIPVETLRRRDIEGDLCQVRL